MERGCNGGRANEDWGRELNESRIYAHTFVRTEGAHLCARKARICAHEKRAYVRTEGAHMCARKARICAHGRRAYVRTKSAHVCARKARICAHGRCAFVRTESAHLCARKVRICAHGKCAFVRTHLCAQKFANKLSIKGSVWGMRNYYGCMQKYRISLKIF
jgi:hypothetical protein